MYRSKNKCSHSHLRVHVVCVGISGRAGGVDACQSIMWLLQSSGWKVLIMPLGTVPNPYQIFPVFNMQIKRWTMYCFCGLPVLCVFSQTDCAHAYLSQKNEIFVFFFPFCKHKSYRIMRCTAKKKIQSKFIQK